MDNKDRGRVIGVQGQIVEVEFAENPPNLHDLLLLEDDKTTRMEVMRSSGTSTIGPPCGMRMWLPVLSGSR